MAQKPTELGKKRGGVKKAPAQPAASAPATPKPAEPAAPPHTAVAAPAPQAVATVAPPPPPVAAQPARAPKPGTAEAPAPKPAPAAAAPAAPAPEPSPMGAEFDAAHKKYGAAYAVMAEGLKGDGVDKLVRVVQYGIAAAAALVIFAAIVSA